MSIDRIGIPHLVRLDIFAFLKCEIDITKTVLLA